MRKKITAKELEFIGFFHTPRALLENLIPKEVNSPAKWSKDSKCITIRDYQLPFLSYEYLVCNDPKLNDKENFEKKQGAGNVYNFSARKTGKSFISLQLDSLLDIIHNNNYITCLASFDYSHIRTIADWICDYVSNHPFFKIFHLTGRKKTVNRGNYNIVTRNGHKLFSVNENVKGTDPGIGFFQHHWNKFLYEEICGESEKGNLKRIDAESEVGAIDRLTGVPMFKKSSPSIKILNDSRKRNWLVRLPQFVSPYWTEKEKQDRINKYNGERSVAYRLNVLAELVKGAYGVFDMEKVSKNVNDNKLVKSFEIGKEDFEDFKNIIVVDKLGNADVTFIASDIGDSGAPSEIIIVFKVKDKYLHRYNITLNGLDHLQEEKIFLWLYNIFGGAFLGFDTTEGKGRAIYRDLARIINRKHLIWVHFSEKIVVGFEKDEKDKMIYDDKGNLKPKYELIPEHSIQRLKELFYTERFDLAMDDKLYRQIDGVVGIKQANKTLYDNKTENHEFQALQVFAIMEWNTQSQPKPEKTESKYSAGVYG